MDRVVKGIGIIIKSIISCPMTRYHLAGIFILLIVQRKNELEPSDYLRELYFQIKFEPTPTKILTWPIRMALCFLLALPNLPDFPLELTVGDQYIFPSVFLTEIISCVILTVHVNNYCAKNATKCYYSDEDLILDEFDDFSSFMTNVLLQISIITHLIYMMWLIKSIMHVIQLVIRDIYKWFMLMIVPKMIPACRVIVLMFVFNLQDAVVPTLCIYFAGKIFIEQWLMPLMDRPMDVNDANDNHTDDETSSELSDEFEDLLEPTD